MKPISKHAVRAGGQGISWCPEDRAGVVGFLHQKGGVGKSTLSLLTAMALQQGDARVLLVDADPQATSSDWCAMHGLPAGIELAALPLPEMHVGLGSRTDVDWVVIDGPPGLSAVTESIVGVADLLLIPCRAALPDVWTLTWLAALVKRQLKRQPKQQLKQGEPAAPLAQVVFNQVSLQQFQPPPPYPPHSTEHTLLEQVYSCGLTVNACILPFDAAITAFFAVGQLPPSLMSLVLRLLKAETLSS